MYAIIEVMGKQYTVKKGSKINVEYLGEDENGKALKTPEIKTLLVQKEDESVVVGAPYVKNAKVTASVLQSGKEDKVLVFKYKRRKNYRRTQGHRQKFHTLMIDSIEA